MQRRAGHRVFEGPEGWNADGGRMPPKRDQFGKFQLVEVEVRRAWAVLCPSAEDARAKEQSAEEAAAHLQRGSVQSASPWRY